MLSTRNTLTFLLALLLAGSLRAEEKATTAHLIIEADRKDNKVMAHADVLTNQIGGRLTGSKNLQRACEWSKGEFEKMGLANVRLEQWGEFPVGFERGHARGRMVKPREMDLEFGTRAWSAGTKGKQRARAVLGPRSREDFDERRDEFKGARVLTSRYGGRSSRVRGGEDLTTALKEADIIGFVRPTSDERIIGGGNYRVNWDDLPTTPTINLVRKQWNAILEDLKNEEAVELEFDIRNKFVKGPVPVYNVIAEIPGEEIPDEIVIVGGHLDSWDVGPGANDNATGCATAIEAARIIMAAGVKPRRTIRFMLWTGEEQGILGSKAYVAANEDEMDKISAALVHDGGSNYVSSIRGTKEMLDQLNKAFAAAKTLDPDRLFRVREVEVMHAGGSDHASFVRAGVPGFFWGQSGRLNYRRIYHTQFDTYDTIIPEYQEHSSIIIALGAVGIANLDDLLPRVPQPKR